MTVTVVGLAAGLAMIAVSLHRISKRLEAIAATLHGLREDMKQPLSDE